MTEQTGGSSGVLLALDTSGSVGSVAVAEGGAVRARAVLTRTSAHASGLIPAVAEVLDAAGLDRAHVDGLVVGEGPGSFTGVRVAGATAKGLSLALGRPLWAISSLAAEAVAAEEAGRVRYALFDARADRIYGACYAVDPEGIETLVAPHAGELGDLLDGEIPPGATFVGDGAEKHATRLGQAGHPVFTEATETTRADGLIGVLARDRSRRPVQDPTSWEPRYVRVAGAERLWSR